VQKAGFPKINITATILVCGSFLLSLLSASAAVDQAKVSAALTMGLQQRQLSHFGEAEQSFKSAIAMSEGGPVDVQARSNEALGGLYMAMRRLQETQGLYEKSIRLLEGTNNKNLLGIAYDNMSRLYQEKEVLRLQRHTMPRLLRSSNLSRRR
jgi:tetratricopeptide (TPR) repeat protein